MSTRPHANPRAPQQPAGTGHTGIYRVLGELTRWYRMQELSGRWKLRVPKATGGAGGPRWLSAQGSGQGTGSQQTQLAQLWLTGRGSFYLLRVAVEQQVANKLGFQIWILLIRYMPRCL